jgi:hypothetical protein
MDEISSELQASHRYGGEGRTTVMLTGCFTLDSSFSKPVDLLPSTILGYDSDAAFNRAFKRMHGVSAGEYRRTIAAA